MLRLAKIILLSGTVFVMSPITHADIRAAVDDVLGPWLTEKEGAVVEIYRCDGNNRGLCGRIVWLREPYSDDGELKRDPENPVQSLRDRPMCGIEVVTELERIDKNTWAHGRVYNPKDGNRYRAYVDANNDGTLHIRAYIGIPLIGKSETWSRPEDIDIGCPAE